MFFICIIIPIVSTAIIGHILAHDNMPKPSIADTAFPRPNPIARTRGTVTGPVVTPALSHPTFTNSSDEKKVNIKPIAYNGKSKVARSIEKINLAIPKDIPVATPIETLYISIDFLKAPFVRFCTVIPRAFNAGSAKVAPNPSKNANIITITKPTISEYIGDTSLIGIFINAAGKILPVCVPIAPVSYTHLTLPTSPKV